MIVHGRKFSHQIYDIHLHIYEPLFYVFLYKYSSWIYCELIFFYITTQIIRRKIFPFLSSDVKKISCRYVKEGSRKNFSFYLFSCIKFLTAFFFTVFLFFSLLYAIEFGRIFSLIYFFNFFFLFQREARIEGS